MEKTNSSNLRSFKAKEEDRQEFCMTNVIMIRDIFRIGIDQVVEIGEFHLLVEFSVDKIIEIDQGMNKAIGMMLEWEVLEEMWECIKTRTLEDRIIEVDIEETIGMKIMKEVGVWLEKGNIKVT